MKTLDRPMQQIEDNSAQLKRLQSEVKELLETPAPSPGTPWAPLAAALALGIVIGIAAAATMI